MNWKTVKKWTPLLILLILIGSAYTSGIHNSFNLSSLQEHKDSFKSYASSHQFSAIIIYGFVYIISVALSLPIATLLTLLGGFLFGKLLGTLVVVSSATIGACILFIIAKSALGTSLREKAGSFYKKAETNMNENAVSYLLFLRLIPVFPFFLVNILPALFNVPLRIFILTTFFGIMPGSFIYVNLGEALGDINSLDDLVSGKTLFALGLIGVFTLIPVLYKKIKAKKDKKSP